MNRIEERLVPVRSGDGASAELIVVAPPAPRAGLLWLPAMGVPARHYRPLAEALADAGIAVALHEWRGIGSSDRRAGRHSDWGCRTLLEDDLPASLAIARARHPTLRWRIGGHSLGAQLAAQWSALAPDRVDGLVLLGGGLPYWRTYPPRQRWLLRTVFAAVPRIAALCGRYPGRRLGFAGNEARGVMRDWSHSGIHGRYAPRGLALDLDAAFARVRLPLLAIALADDRYVPSASLDLLLDRFADAPQRRIELAGAAFPSGRATHFSWMREPAPVAAAIAAWCDEIN